MGCQPDKSIYLKGVIFMRGIRFFERDCSSCKHSALVKEWGDLKCMDKKCLVPPCGICDSYEKRAENEEIDEAKGVEDT